MRSMIKCWREKSLFVPWVGLCLILLGMQAAVCTTLGGAAMPYREMSGIYCLASLLLIAFASLPERWLWKVALILFAGMGILAWRNRWDIYILEQAEVLAYYANQRYQEYMGHGLFPEEWCILGRLKYNVALIGFCVLAGMYVAWATLKLQSKLFMAMPIILLYCGALLLGVTPGQLPTLLLVLGMALEMQWISEHQKIRNPLKLRGRTEQAGSRKRICMAALILAVALSLSWQLTARISGKVFRDVSRIQVRQHEMEQDLQFFVEKSGQQIRGMLGIDSGGYLSNTAPKYRNEKVFDVTLSGKPTTSVYLRGFVGDIYQNGKWKASKNIHLSNDKRKNGVWTGKYNGSNYTAFLQEEQDMEIHYTKLGKRSKYLYLPYAKNGEINEISRKEQNLCLGGKDDELPLYRDLADRIANDASWGEDDLIQSVQGILWGNAAYSLTLEPIPGNRDYAEHFLFYSQMGYCEHFATAGTLLLRHLNQKARYVSGYRISPDRFIKREDGTYIAGVLDSDAHAWSEVWVDRAYWMPQEMTPGIDDAEGIGSVQGKPWESISEDDQTGIVAPTEPPVPSPTSQVQEAEEPEETEETEETEAPSESPGTGTVQAGDSGGAGSGGSIGIREKLHQWWQGMARWQRISLGSAGIVVFCLLIVAAVRHGRLRKRMQHMAQLRKQNRSAYIRMRLGMFLNRLHHSGVAVKATMPEGQWMQILSETLQEQADPADMEIAAELIRRAAYSGEEVTEAEAGWFDGYCKKTESRLAAKSLWRHRKNRKKVV